MNQIVIKVQGGLGNQVFQYLFGLSLASLPDTDVWFDISEYILNNGIRKFALNKLNLDGNFFSCQKEFNESTNSISLNKIKIHTSKVSIKKKLLQNLQYFSESGIKNNFELNKITSGYYEGYWISYHYWNNPESLIQGINQKLDIVANKLNLDKLIDTNSLHSSCAVHVRRGDYLSPEHINWHGVCSNEYYIESISSIPHKNVYFFSDDSTYLDDVFGHMTGFINASNLISNEVNEFLLLRKFPNIVLSNSSYSYLAALLSSFRQTQNNIVYPYPWYKWADLHPLMLDNWKRRNNLTGLSENEDLAQIQMAKVGIILECESEESLSIQLEDLSNQTHQPVLIYVVGNLNLISSNLKHLIYKYSKFYISLFTSIQSALYAISNEEINKCQYFSIFRINERWLPNKIRCDIKTCIELNADISISSIYIHSEKDKFSFNNILYEDISNKFILDDRRIRNIILEQSSVLFNIEALLTALRIGHSDINLIVSFSDLFYEIGLANLKFAIQNERNVYHLNFECIQLNQNLNIERYLLTFIKILNDSRVNIELKRKIYSFINKVIDKNLNIYSINRTKTDASLAHTHTQTFRLNFIAKLLSKIKIFFKF